MGQSNIFAPMRGAYSEFPLLREGLCGVRGARDDLQHEHGVIISLPEGMEEGSVKQTCAKLISLAKFGLFT